MSLSSDAKTFALYNLTSGGTNLGPGGSVWTITAAGDGSFARDASAIHLATFQDGAWTVEAELQLAGDTAGTVLELAGWGESESVNIQAVVGWGADRRLFVGWETGAGLDHVLTSTAQLPIGTPLRIAAVCDGGHVYLVANGSKIAEAWGVPLPTGGTSGGSPTPGTKLSFRKRVSATSGVSSEVTWVRLSSPRTVEELHAEWAALGAAAPVAVSGSWEDLARRDRATAYYVFRGRFGDSGPVVMWATRPVRHPDDGLIEGRLLSAPDSIVSGIPETYGAMPERTSVAISLDNTDRALDAWFIGGTGAEDEYGGDSFLTLRGKLWLGLKGADGQNIEKALTPTLCCAGSPTFAEGRIVLPMASRDEGILGPTSKLITVEELKGADALAAGDARLLDGSVLTFPTEEWKIRRGRFTESLDAVVPCAYGRSAIELTPVAKGGRYLAFLSMSEPRIDDATAWVFEQEKFEAHEFRTDRLWLWKIQVSVERDDGTTLTPWVVGLDLRQVADEVADRRSYLIPPASNHTGMPDGVLATPANIAKQIVIDLSGLGSAAVDSASFQRASKALPRAGICGGVVRSDAALAEVLTHICAFGLALTVESDDRLHCHVVGGWSAEEKQQAESGDLTHIGMWEIGEGTWAERLPVGSSERGAPATRVSVDWSSEQAEFWPARYRRQRAPGLAAAQMSQESEARISGAWIFPPNADDALSTMASRRVFATRRVGFVVLSPWPAALARGSLLRVSHPWGMGGGGAGYSQRLMRLERTELSGKEHACRVVLEDLGPVESIRPGLLDTITNWMKYAPSADNCAIGIVGGDTWISFDTPVADPSWVGCTLGIWRPGNPSNRGTYRIVAVGGANDVQVDRPFLADDYIDSPTPRAPIDEPWIVLKNRASEGWGYRPEYITLADEATGLHSDGSAGFRMTSG